MLNIKLEKEINSVCFFCNEFRPINGYAGDYMTRFVSGDIKIQLLDMENGCFVIRSSVAYEGKSSATQDAVVTKKLVILKQEIAESPKQAFSIFESTIENLSSPFSLDITL